MDTYYKKQWEIWEDGGSGTWLYVRQQGVLFYFIEIMDMVDAAGRDSTEWFCATLKVVDLSKVPLLEQRKALLSWGGGLSEDTDTNEACRRAAYACASYGLYAPMFQETAVPVKDPYAAPDERHPGFRALRARAREAAEELYDEEVLYAALSERVVNAAGSTAKERMCGDLWSALRRVQEAGEDATPEQQLLLQIYGRARHTLGGDEIPKDLQEGA